MLRNVRNREFELESYEIGKKGYENGPANRIETK